MKIRAYKKAFYRIHGWIGTKLSMLLFIVCFSGTLATLSHEMDWFFIPAMRATPQGSLASRNLIISNLQKIYPNGNITYWMRQDEPYLCDIIYLREGDDRNYVFANPYTGKIEGDAKLTFQRYFRDLHYFLFIPDQVGNFIVLAFGFLLFISLITALLYYKNWWKKLFILQTGRGALVFIRSLHRLIGVWSVPFTILISVTGIWYFVERADIAGVSARVNPRSPEIVTSSTEADETINLGYTIDYDRVVKISQEEIPNLEVQSLSPAINYKNTIYVRGKSDVPLVRQRANRVYINPLNYEVVKVQNAKSISRVMWINDIADPLHFGYWGGLVTKIIWFLMGMGISTLVLTGIWTTLKLQMISRRKNRTKVLGVWRYLNWAVFGVMIYFMYARLLITYQPSATGILIITIGWILLIGVAYYVFVYRLNRVVDKKLNTIQESV